MSARRAVRAEWLSRVVCGTKFETSPEHSFPHHEFMRRRRCEFEVSLPVIESQSVSTWLQGRLCGVMLKQASLT